MGRALGRVAGAVGSANARKARFDDLFGAGRGSEAAQARRDDEERVQQQQDDFAAFAVTIAAGAPSVPWRRWALGFAAEFAASLREQQSVDATVERMVAWPWDEQVSPPTPALRWFWLTLLADDITPSCAALPEVAQQALGRYFASSPDPIDVEWLVREFCMPFGRVYPQRLAPVCVAVAAEIAKPAQCKFKHHSSLTHNALVALELAPDAALAEGGCLHSWIGALEKRLTLPGGGRRKLKAPEDAYLKNALAAHPPGTPGADALAPLRRWWQPAGSQPC